MRGRAALKRRVIAYGSRAFDRHVVWVLLRAPLGLKQRRRLKSPVKPYPIEDKLRAKRKAHEPGSN